MEFEASVSALGERELSAIEAEADGDCSNCMTLLAEARRLRADTERLRALIKKAERVAGDGDECPFCGRWVEHRRSCDAFTPDGDVK